MKILLISITCMTLLATSCGRSTTTPRNPTFLPTRIYLQTPTLPPSPSASTTHESTQNPPSSSSSPTSPYEQVVDLAKADLARRLKADPQVIRLLRIRGDEFPAGDLGCPGPSVTPRPIPALVSGQVIVFEYSSQEYTYHTRRGQVVFCGPW